MSSPYQGLYRDEMAGGCLWASTRQMTPIRHPHVSPSCYLSQQISDMAYNFSEIGENVTVLKVTTSKERHRGALEFCWAAIRMCLACLEVAHFRGKIKSFYLDINIYIRGWQIFLSLPLVCPSFLFFLLVIEEERRICFISYEMF